MPVGLGGIGAILALASALGNLFRGGGGEKEGAEDGGMSEELKRLFPQLEEQIRLDRLQQLRQSFLTDPDLVNFIPQGQRESLGLGGVSLEGLASGGVPLQRAVVNLAFGLLPRFARGGFLNEEQRRLGRAAPRTRFGRTGYGEGEGGTFADFESGQSYSDVVRRQFPELE